MSRNPVLKQKYISGYKEGFEKGIEVGREEGLKEGVNASTSFFMEKFSTLAEARGIGPKTIEKVKQVLGEQYFE